MGPYYLPSILVIVRPQVWATLTPIHVDGIVCSMPGYTARASEHKAVAKRNQTALGERHGKTRQQKGGGGTDFCAAGWQRKKSRTKKESHLGTNFSMTPIGTSLPTIVLKMAGFYRDRSGVSGQHGEGMASSIAF